MKRIRTIQEHPLFMEQYTLLQEAEKDRFFCRHTMEHFVDVFDNGKADAALAASVFHFNEISIKELKHYLKANNINVRTI